MCWRYVPAYVHPEDKLRLAGTVEELAQKHGVILEEFPGERVAKARQTAQTAKVGQAEGQPAAMAEPAA